MPVEIKNETVWLSVSQMALLFDREESNIRRHVLNVFKENEVKENNNVQKMHVNNVKKPVPFYSLDVIISVGYRVKSNRGVEFRRWANSILKQYILQGYAVNQKRIAATMFLYFLDKNMALFDKGRKRIEDATLVALTIMIAESHPEEKEMMISVVMNCMG